MSFLYRAKALELYRLLLTAAKMTLPTKTARDFMIQRVRSEYRRNRNETNRKKIESELTRAYNVIMALAEQDQKAATLKHR